MKTWKSIIGFERMYEVSESGDIRSLDRRDRLGRLHKGVTMKTFDNGKGYLKCIIYKDGKPKKIYVHREVAKSFLPNPDNKKEVNHIDGNSMNNHLSNLEWCTKEENMKHAADTNLMPKGESHCNSVLTEDQVWYILNSKKRNKELSEELDHSANNISRIRLGRRWSHIYKKWKGSN